MSAEKPTFTDGVNGEPASLAEALTSLSPNFIEEIAESEPWFMVSNDRGLQDGYLRAAYHIPEPTPGKQGAIVIVGNGSFETAAQIFPERPLLFCDKNAVSLFAQRVIVETLRDNDSPEGFLEQMKRFDEALRERNRHGVFDIGESYADQQRDWNDKGQEPKHFLTNQEAYDTARMALVDRTIGYWQIDFDNETEISELGQALDACNVEIGLANITNLFVGKSRHDGFRISIQCVENRTRLEITYAVRTR